MAKAMEKATPYEGGFADPVGASQAVFRRLMEAMARPGSIHPLPDVAAPPAPLSASAAALIATLADADTPVWLDPALAKVSEVREWIVFHTGAPITGQQQEAAFALVASPECLPSFNGFSLGTQEYPDRSTTIILQVDTLTDGAALSFEGPGIRSRVSIAPSPLPSRFAEHWRSNRAAFPRGVDLVFAAPGAVMALPRSARLISGEA